VAKASKAAKARVKRASMTDMKAIRRAARVLADYELITNARYAAILRAIPSRYH